MIQGEGFLNFSMPLPSTCSPHLSLILLSFLVRAVWIFLGSSNLEIRDLTPLLEIEDFWKYNYHVVGGQGAESGWNSDP